MASTLRSRSARPQAAVLVLAAVAVASLIASLAGRGGRAGSPPSAAPGPATSIATTVAEPVVPVGALAALPRPSVAELTGVVSVLASDCAIARYQVLVGTVATMRLGSPCAGRLSASGTAAVATAGNPIPPVLAGRELRAMLPGGRDVPIGLRAGWATGGEAVASDDGAVATCRGGIGPPVTDVWRAGVLHEIDGCWPTFDGERLLVGRLGGLAAVADEAGRTVIPRRLVPSTSDRIVPAAAGPLVAVAHGDGPATAIDVFDIAGGVPRRVERVAAASPDAVTTARLAPGGKAVALLGRRWRLVAWDDPAHPRSIESIGGSTIIAVAFSPDGRAAAVATGDGVALVHLPTLRPFAALPGAEPRDVAWSAAFDG